MVQDFFIGKFEGHAFAGLACYEMVGRLAHDIGTSNHISQRAVCKLKVLPKAIPKTVVDKTWENHLLRPPSERGSTAREG